MNLPPVSSTFASSLAGSVKASAEKSSADAAETNTTQHQIADLQVDGVVKSNASDDSEADGRQLLDTFERRSKPDDEAEQDDQAPSDRSQALSYHMGNDHESPRPRLDLQG